MKVQVVQLDPSDDLPSILEKLRWTKTPRVVLVWPEEGRPIGRLLDLVLLQREAQRAGAQLGVASADPVVQEQARRLAIPTFSSAEQFPARAWRRTVVRRPMTPARSPSPAEIPERPPHIGGIRWPSWISERAGRLIVLALMALAWVGVAAVIVPSAQVVITPRRVDRSQAMTITIDPEALSPAEGLQVPGMVHFERVAADHRIPSGGTVVVPLTSSRGEMVFTNLGAEAVRIPRGLGIRTLDRENIRFVTTEEADLPARKLSKVSIEVEADQPGSKGNLPAGIRWAVEGELGLYVSAANPNPISGGMDGPRAGVSEDDLKALRELLTAQLFGEALARMLLTLEADQALPRESLRVDRVVSEAFDAEAGDPADSLGLHLELEVSGLSYHPYDLFVAANEHLVSEIPEGWHQVPGSMNLAISGPPEWLDGKRMGLMLQAGHRLYPSVDPGPLRRRLRGLPAEEAGPWLARTLQLEESPYLRIWPPWFPWMPWVETRITLRFPWEAG